MFENQHMSHGLVRALSALWAAGYPYDGRKVATVCKGAWAVHSCLEDEEQERLHRESIRVAERRQALAWDCGYRNWDEVAQEMRQEETCSWGCGDSD